MSSNYNDMCELLNDTLEKSMEMSITDKLNVKLEYIAIMLKRSVTADKFHTLKDIRPVIDQDKGYCGLEFITHDSDYKKKNYILKLFDIFEEPECIEIDDKAFNEIGIDHTHYVCSTLGHLLPNISVKFKSIENKMDLFDSKKDYTKPSDIIKFMSKDIVSDLILEWICENLSVITNRVGELRKKWTYNVSDNKLSFVLIIGELKYNFNLLEDGKFRKEINYNDGCVSGLNSSQLHSVANCLQSVFKCIKFKVNNEPVSVKYYSLLDEDEDIYYSGKASICDEDIINLETVGNFIMVMLLKEIIHFNNKNRNLTELKIDWELEQTDSNIKLIFRIESTDSLNLVLPIVRDGKLIKEMDTKDFNSVTGINIGNLFKVLTPVFPSIRFKINGKEYNPPKDIEV